MKLSINKLTEGFFLLTLLLIPFYGVRFEILYLPTNVPEAAALLSILLFIVGRGRLVLGEWKKNILGFYLPLLLLFTGLAFSYLTNDPTLDGLGIIKGWFFIPFLFSISIPSVFENPEKTRKALLFLFLSMAIVSWIAVSYKLAGKLTYDGRLAAFYSSPNQLSMYLSLGVFIFPFLFKTAAGSRMKLFLFSSLLAIIISLYFSYSYAAWLAVALSSILLLALKTSSVKKYLLLATAIISIFFLFQQSNPKLSHMFEERSSFSSRIMIWKSALRIAHDNPLLGIGPANFQGKYLEYQRHFPPYLEWAVPHPHNIYLAFWLQAGLLGLCGFLILCHKSVSLFLKQKNTALSAVFLGIFFYTLIHGIADTPYWRNDLSYMFWTVFFLGITSTRKDAAQKSNR
ncbi:MAG: O-antigen polymerase [Candidatus Moranbacteria bacterium GW2011_GWE1_49_15]|nr:MAG: O-antigen polymerase [Candidatus Moranbacteria bacterium GW2011_GWE2_47_10]KKW07341.1 MAG: O-antigen polymerase [Candidatus Moranbacteria bacterium GW2011_GWE1_49_15]